MRRFWIRWDVEKGVITVGSGMYNTHPLLSWTDPDPIPDIKYYAVSAWDTAVGEWEFERTEGIGHFTQVCSNICCLCKVLYCMLQT